MIKIISALLEVRNDSNVPKIRGFIAERGGISRGFTVVETKNLMGYYGCSNAFVRHLEIHGRNPDGTEFDFRKTSALPLFNEQRNPQCPYSPALIDVMDKNIEKLSTR